MQETTLVSAVLLSVGFAAAKPGQLIRLPSVTGYILAGLVLGPSGFGLVTADTIDRNLEHFTQIALMLIAFGIGEHRPQYACAASKFSFPSHVHGLFIKRHGHPQAAVAESLRRIHQDPLAPEAAARPAVSSGMAF